MVKANGADWYTEVVADRILIHEPITTSVLKVEDLTHILSISRNTAYELVRSGKIHSVKIGRTYRIPCSAVEDYLNTHDETGIM